MTGIYEIVHVASGRAYIGSSDDTNRRLLAHRALLRRGVHENVWLQRTWSRDGDGAFEFRTIEEHALEGLREREEEVIAERGLVFNVSPVVRQGARAPNCSLSDEVVRAIYEAAAGGALTPDLEARFGAPHHVVSRIVGGRTYRRITGGQPARRQIRARGARHPHSKLNAEMVRELRATYTGKYGEKTVLARRHGVTVHTVVLALRGETWSHV